MSEDGRTRTVIADPHWLARLAVRGVLEDSGEFEVAGEAENAAELLSLAETLRPGLVVMEVEYPDRSGPAICRELAALSPESRMLVLTRNPDEELGNAVLQAGALGYVRSSSTPEPLLAAAKAVAGGEYHMPSWLVGWLLEKTRYLERWRNDAVPRLPLTKNQRETLRLFALGNSYGRIAEIMGKRPLTVRNQVLQIRHKLRVRTVQELTLWAAKNGLVD